jgi:hypothetical protein
MAIPVSPSVLNLRIHFLMFVGCAPNACPISTAVLPSDDNNMTAAREASSLLEDLEQRSSSSLSSCCNSRTNNGWNILCALQLPASKLLRHFLKLSLKSDSQPYLDSCGELIVAFKYFYDLTHLVH